MRVRILSLAVLSLVLVTGTALAETVAGLPLHVQKFDSGAIRVWIGDHISSTATVAIRHRRRAWSSSTPPAIPRWTVNCARSSPASWAATTSSS